MVELIGLLPLLAALVLLVVAFLGDALEVVDPFDFDLDAWFTQLARRYFGHYVPEDAPDRKWALRAAYVDEAYRSYAAKTYLFALIAGLAGLVIGVYLTGALLLALPTLSDLLVQSSEPIANALGRPELEPTLTPRQVFLVLLAGGAIFGVFVAALAYWLRWELPRRRAEIRRRGINEGLPRTIAFVYALTRGGMEIPAVLQTLARNRSVYGEGADEIAIAAREMELFGADIITAFNRMSERTPSDQFKTFSQNFSSVLQSGQNISTFLRQQYDRYQEEAADRQADILELLSTIAEAYVTVLVAGTLFLMTILLVFGLTSQPTLGSLQLMAYVIIPFGNLAFVGYLSRKLDLLGISRGTDVSPLRESLEGRQWVPESAVGVTDGGQVRSDPSWRQLERYDSVRSLRNALTDPVSTLLSRPTRLLYVTVPLALVFVALRAPAAFNEAGFNARLFDDTLIRAALFVLGTFAVVWELYTRRISRIERAMPDLLDRLASLNEAGMSIVESLDRVREGDLAALSEEVDRMWRDIAFGATVDDAFRRFGLRVRTTTTTRLVTLLTNALRASGNLGPVLGIAAEQAQDELRLRRQRRQEMLTYLVVIYLAFFVFLVIILAVQEVLVPSLPNNVPTPTAEDTARLGIQANQFSRFGQVNTGAYTLVFFHTAMIQAVMSGLIAGQLGSGSIKDGAKHAAIMLGLAYALFLVLSGPTADIAFQDQSVEANAVVVDSVSLSDGGFVVVRESTPDGPIVGQSEYLVPGTHEDVRIQLDDPPEGDETLYAVPHQDTDDSETFDFTGPDSTVDQPYPGGRTPIADPARVEFEA